MSLTRAQLLRRGAGVAVALLVPKVPLPPLPVVRQYNYESIIRTPLGHGNYFMANDVIRNEYTGEIMRITAIDQDHLTVLRNFERRIWLGA